LLVTAVGRQLALATVTDEVILGIPIFDHGHSLVHFALDLAWRQVLAQEEGLGGLAWSRPNRSGVSPVRPFCQVCIAERVFKLNLESWRPLSHLGEIDREVLNKFRHCLVPSFMRSPVHTPLLPKRRWARVPPNPEEHHAPA